jgi:hypothetical protein
MTGLPSYWYFLYRSCILLFGLAQRVPETVGRCGFDLAGNKQQCPAGEKLNKV